MNTKSLLAVVAAFSSIVTARTAAAQLTVPGSKDETISIFRNGQTIDVDVSQAKLGFTALKEIRACPLTRKRRDLCLADVITPHVDFTGRAAISAEDGKRSLFSDGKITPGFELGGTLSLNWEKPNGAGNVGDRTRVSTHSIYIALLAKTTLTQSALLDSVAKTAKVSDRTTTSISPSVGYNYAATQSNVIGFSFGAQRITNSSGDAKPQQVCVSTFTGVDEKAHVVTAATCDDRIVVPLNNEWVIQPRVDYLRHFPKSDTLPHTTFGFLASASGSRRSDQNMALNFVVGPTLHPPKHPNDVLAAVLATFSDVTDANRKDKTFKDMFAIKLFVAIPLTGL